MKLKKVVALCNKAKGFRLFDKIDSTGEITQWLGDGYAIYPLNGLPILDEETLCAVEIPCPIGGRAGHDTALRAGHAGRSKLYRGKSGPFDCGGDLPLQSCERKIRDAA